MYTYITLSNSASVRQLSFSTSELKFNDVLSDRFCWREIWQARHLGRLSITTLCYQDVNCSLSRSQSSTVDKNQTQCRNEITEWRNGTTKQSDKRTKRSDETKWRNDETGRRNEVTKQGAKWRIEVVKWHDETTTNQTFCPRFDAIDIVRVCCCKTKRYRNKN